MISGPNNGGLSVEVSQGEASWTNPQNAAVEDDGFAACVLSDQERANFLDIAAFGDFAGVAGGDTITHLTVEVLCKANSAFGLLESVQVIKGGNPVGDMQGVAANVSNGLKAWISSGSQEVARMGAALNGSDVNSSGFGIRLQFRAGVSPTTISVDAVRVSLAGSFTG